MESSRHRDLLNELARLYGISPEYHDVFGQPHTLLPETRDALLSAMDLDVGDPVATAAEVAKHHDAPWLAGMPPVRVIKDGQDDAIPLHLPRAVPVDELGFTITFESGFLRQGRIKREWIEETEQREFKGQPWVRYLLRLPDLPGHGYHQLTIRRKGQPAPLGACTLILTPARCYLPPELRDGGRSWGVAAQLYSLRSHRDWGMGDFTELSALVGEAARLGAQTVGLNPLHALFPHNPRHESPYCPSSRLFFNYLYIDVDAIEELGQCDLARALISDADFVQRKLRAREAELVDYEAVAALKRPVLEALYVHFRDQHLAQGTMRGKAFKVYKDARGEDLRLHALYEALQEHFFASDQGLWGWPVWPETYRSPDSPAVADFARQNPDRIQFFQYLQWLAEVQLNEVAEAAESSHMALGLYMDLSVSVDQAGAEVWANQALYAPGASVGAPPDALGPMGQDWGLPPMVPERLKQVAYRPFVNTLRQNMRHAGALRMDHAMQLMRLFWIPRGRPATEGAYVNYPLDDLLGVLALESHRNKCLVIGEDLGTVPDEVRHAMGEAGVLSYRLLIFERREGGDFKRPEEYPAQALVTVATHDLPTLAAWWEGYDNDLRERLGLLHEWEQQGEHRDLRDQERRWLLGALAEHGLLPAGTPDDPAQLPHLTRDLGRAIQVYLSRAESHLLVVQLEDLLCQVSQANMPSTTHEHPNWKVKLTATLDEMMGDEEIWAAARALKEIRG